MKCQCGNFVEVTMRDVIDNFVGFPMKCQSGHFVAVTMRDVRDNFVGFAMKNQPEKELQHFEREVPCYQQ